MVDRPAHAATARPAPVELALCLLWRTVHGLVARIGRYPAVPGRHRATSTRRTLRGGQ